MRGYGVTAAGDAVGVDAGGSTLAADFSAVAVPAIGEGVFRIEIPAAGSRRDRLSHHHFAGLHGTISRGGHRGGATPTNDDSALQAKIVLVVVGVCASGDWTVVIKTCVQVIRLHCAQRKSLGQLDVKTAARGQSKGGLGKRVASVLLSSESRAPPKLASRNGVKRVWFRNVIRGPNKKVNTFPSTLSPATVLLR